jgi:hypothetical protein
MNLCDAFFFEATLTVLVEFLGGDPEKRFGEGLKSTVFLDLLVRS